MGILKRLFGGSDKPHSASPASSALQRTAQAFDMAGMDSAEGLVKLSGTTMFAKDAIGRLASRRGLAENGYLEIAGSIQREPENQADPTAIAVHVEGERIGYLPGYLARTQSLSAGASRPVQVQIFTDVLPKGLRAEAWAWLGSKRPQWEWSETNRPPLSSKAKNQAAHQGSVDMVQEAVAGGGQRADQFKAGMTNGVHYLELVEPIKELKREGRLEEALVLCFAAIDGAEKSAKKEKSGPAPWYTEQAAIVLRKLGRRDEEIAVLERWIAACPPQYRGASKIKDRLDKLQA